MILVLNSHKVEAGAERPSFLRLAVEFISMPTSTPTVPLLAVAVDGWAAVLSLRLVTPLIQTH